MECVKKGARDPGAIHLFLLPLLSRVRRLDARAREGGIAILVPVLVVGARLRVDYVVAVPRDAARVRLAGGPGERRVVEVHVVGNAPAYEHAVRAR